MPPAPYTYSPLCYQQSPPEAILGTTDGPTLTHRNHSVRGLQGSSVRAMDLNA